MNDISEEMKQAGFTYREITEEMKNHPKYDFIKEFLKDRTLIEICEVEE